MDGVETLCAVLDEEIFLCGQLGLVLRAEQRAVVELRSQSILACLTEREALREALVQLATRRRVLAREIGVQCRLATASVTALLPHLPPESRARLRERLRGLRGALLRARSLERQNGLLTRARLGAGEEPTSIPRSSSSGSPRRVGLRTDAGIAVESTARPA